MELGKILILIPTLVVTFIVGTEAFLIGNSSFTTHIKDFPYRINIPELLKVVGSCLRALIHILSFVHGLIEAATTVLWRSVKLSFVQLI